MKLRTHGSRRRLGQALVEYALLLAGVALVCTVAIALLGDKTRNQYGVLAAILPGAHPNDNKPLGGGEVIPLDTSGSTITLNSGELVNSSGVDRMEDILGAGGGAILIQD